MIKIDRNNLGEIARDYSGKIWRLILKNRVKNNRYATNLELLDQIKRLYISPPGELVTQHSVFEDFIQSQSNKIDQNELKKVFFDYKSVFEWRIEQMSVGHWLANRLNVKTCPYCNRQYTFTISTNKKIRPQFDHFYPQKKYPYLALSFYNLIPCCSICNHTKRDQEIDIHPYISSFSNDYKFEIENLSKALLSSGFSNDEFTIRFTANNKNIEELALTSLYQMHSDYIAEIVCKARMYNEGYFKSLQESFGKLGLSSEEMNLLIFGNYIEVAKHENRPLSKLTKDILNQIFN